MPRAQFGRCLDSPSLAWPRKAPISQPNNKAQKNILVNFFAISMKSLYAKLQLSSFKTERGV